MGKILPVHFDIEPVQSWLQQKVEPVRYSIKEARSRILTVADALEATLGTYVLDSELEDMVGDVPHMKNQGPVVVVKPGSTFMDWFRESWLARPVAALAGLATLGAAYAALAPSDAGASNDIGIVVDADTCLDAQEAQSDTLEWLPGKANIREGYTVPNGRDAILEARSIVYDLIESNGIRGYNLAAITLSNKPDIPREIVTGDFFVDEVSGSTNFGERLLVKRWERHGLDARHLQLVLLVDKRNTWRIPTDAVRVTVLDNDRDKFYAVEFLRDSQNQYMGPEHSDYITTLPGHIWQRLDSMRKPLAEGIKSLSEPTVYANYFAPN